MLTDNERRERLAMKKSSEALLSALITHHPRILHNLHINKQAKKG